MTKPKLTWLKLAEAAQLIANQFPDTSSPEQILKLAIAEGQVSVRGFKERIVAPKDRRAVIRSVKDKLNGRREWFSYPRSKGKAKLHYFLNEYDWQSYVHEDEIVLFDPDDSDFLIVLSSIEIRESDLNHYMSKSFRWSVLSSEGRQKQSDDWLLLTASLLFLEREGELNLEIFPKRSDLRKRLLDMWHGAGLGERAIKHGVDVMHQLFVRREGSGENASVDSEKPDVVAALKLAQSQVNSKRMKS